MPLSPHPHQHLLKFLGKWMELENIILNEVTQAQKNHTWYALTYKWILAQKLGIPNGREAPEKMFNILNHQGNVNQNNPEIPPHRNG